ncbi:hypothetical protein SISNIDRAFT_143408 [Sistotremastrum niveocremeum HHB9708]|uniref:C2H2-type domain-containing protein n=1 Tax=Sistotremastrum niveocremeum HHB9708 TaxID=1314777 RepID=A0A165A3D5_9AGAM|nr:hypothetical protein SISNIDRAFT_143408 [Sistotremastrum niveocremeum HHB9708]
MHIALQDIHTSETQFFASSSTLNTTTLPSSFHSSHRPDPLPRIETSLQAPSSGRLNENPHVSSYVADPLPRPRSSPVSPHNQHNANQDSLHAGPSWAVHGVHPRVPTRSSSLSDLRWLRNASPLLVVQDLPEVSPSRERSHSVSSTNSSPRLMSTRVTVPRHACPYCDKMFSRPSSLKIHENSHTGAKRMYIHCGDYVAGIETLL